jgi:hypothetical protein
MKTSELTGAALDWAVANCEGLIKGLEHGYAPSSNWEQGGAIIQREWINITNQDDVWTAETADDVPDGYVTMQGETPLVAAMRCYVAQRIGDEIEVPEELLDSIHEC